MLWRHLPQPYQPVHKHHVALPTQAQTHGILRALHPFSILQLNRDAAVEANLRYTPVSTDGQGLIRVRVRVGSIDGQPTLFGRVSCGLNRRGFARG